MTRRRYWIEEDHYDEQQRAVIRELADNVTDEMVRALWESPHGWLTSVEKCRQAIAAAIRAAAK